MIILDFVALALVMSFSKIDVLPAKVVGLVSRDITGPSGRNATLYPNPKGASCIPKYDPGLAVDFRRLSDAERVRRR